MRIFLSGGLDEDRIADLLAHGAPADGFGVGTGMVTSADAPALDMAYKLVEYAGSPRTKLSSRKRLHPGRKQVFRTIEGGRMVGDVVGRLDEKLPGEPLLEAVMRGGRRLPAGRTTLADAREHCLRQVAQLPEALRELEAADAAYPVRFSDALADDLEALRRDLAGPAK